MRTRKNKKRIKAFLKAIEEVYRTHGISISHEDTHGAFILEPLDENDISWIKMAKIDPDLTKQFPEKLYPFQRDIVSWAMKRSATIQTTA